MQKIVFFSQKLLNFKKTRSKIYVLDCHSVPVRCGRRAEGEVQSRNTEGTPEYPGKSHL